MVKSCIREIRTYALLQEYEINEGAEDFQTLTFNIKPHGFYNAKPEAITFRWVTNHITNTLWYPVIESLPV